MFTVVSGYKHWNSNVVCLDANILTIFQLIDPEQPYRDHDSNEPQTSLTHNQLKIVSSVTCNGLLKQQPLPSKETIGGTTGEAWHSRIGTDQIESGGVDTGSYTIVATAASKFFSIAHR